MQLRDYQCEFVSAIQRDWMEFDRVLGVAATGAGKTAIAAEIARQRLPLGPVLFLADAQELVRQTADKFLQFAGLMVAVEMADSQAVPGDGVVVATTQSIARRLDKWPRDYFRTVIVDEAHRNTLGTQAQQVLGYFGSAQTLGITATPFRSDRQQLGSFYQTISCEIGLVRLVKEGWLSRITIKSVPIAVDLRGVRTTAGDYRDDDLGAAIAPHLERCAQILKENAADRRTVVFLPLIETSRAFCAACRRAGLNAVHVDGKDRSALRGDWQVICNASLLTTGWDEPSVSCVYILRPTKSLVLYSQMVGRGTRTYEGKKDLLLLDPLYLADSMDLIRPARLIAHTPEEVASVQKVLDAGGEPDLLKAEEHAVADRRKSMLDRMRRSAQRKAKTIDAFEFALSVGDDKLADYEPEMAWEKAAPSAKQLEAIARFGFDSAGITCKGQASHLLDLLFARMNLRLATAKQVRWLVKFNFPSPWTATFEEASAFLDKRFGRKSAA